MQNICNENCSKFMDLSDKLNRIVAIARRLALSTPSSLTFPARPVSKPCLSPLVAALPRQGGGGYPLPDKRRIDNRLIHKDYPGME